MGLDIKIPIGLMFLILGIILTVFGFITMGDQGMYAKSLNVNVNLWTGLFMVVISAVLLLTSKWVRKG